MFDMQDRSWLIIAAAVGALILWCKELPDNKRVYGLSELFELMGIPQVTRFFAQMIIFLALGTFVALILTNPSHAKQAFAAGLGWTAGLSTSKRKPRGSAKGAPRTSIANQGGAHD
jgi:hypothetical protein